MLFDSFDGEIGVVGEFGHLGGDGWRDGRLDDDVRFGAIRRKRLDDFLTADGWGGSGWFVGVIFGVFDSVAHLIDNFGMMLLLFLGDEVAEASRAGMVKHVSGIIGFSVELVAHWRVGGFDSVTFGVDDICQEGEAMISFFLGNVANTFFFNLFRGGDEDG